VAYFNSAGNYSNRSYESTSINFATATVSSVSASPQTYYDFGGGDVQQRVTIPLNGEFLASLQWDQPFFTVNGVKTNLDWYVLRGDTGAVVASSANDNIANQSPVEFVSFVNTTGQTAFDIVVRKTAEQAGGVVGRLKYIDARTITFNEFGTNSPTIFGHSSAVNGMAVAAVPYFDHRTTESFTSVGPSTILFSATG